MSRHFYNPIFGNADAALRNAFLHCGQLAIAGQHAHITLAVSAKGNLDGMISSFIGDEAVRVLQRDKRLVMRDLTLHLATERIPIQHRGPVLAAFATLAHVKTLAKSPHTTHLVYIPWQEDELPAFRKLFPDAQPVPESATQAAPPR